MNESSLKMVHSEAHVEPGYPAQTVMTDLRVAPSVIVPVSEPLVETRRLMQMAGVRMAFVVDTDGGVTGLATVADLQGERPMLAAAKRAVSLPELSVGDVMTPVAGWVTLDIRSVERAEVGDIAATFAAVGQRYLIVTERVADLMEGPGAPLRTVVRGLFSANRVERALGQSIEIEPRARSFADLAAALDHS
ncbi:MAG TPA: hypothetical protein VLA16_09900 [Ideonella sp.]|nr:hypothetical protein [Ideonella sp.]